MEKAITLASAACLGVISFLLLAMHGWAALAFPVLYLAVGWGLTFLSERDRVREQRACEDWKAGGWRKETCKNSHDDHRYSASEEAVQFLGWPVLLTIFGYQQAKMGVLLLRPSQYVEKVADAAEMPVIGDKQPHVEDDRV